MWFELLGEISNTETIAAGTSIREIGRLRRCYGQGRRRKKKGVGTVQLADGTMCKDIIEVRDRLQLVWKLSL